MTINIAVPISGPDNDEALVTGVLNNGKVRRVGFVATRAMSKGMGEGLQRTNDTRDKVNGHETTNQVVIAVRANNSWQHDDAI